MELMKAVEHYATAMKLSERYGNEHGDMDAANNAWHECKKYADLQNMPTCTNSQTVVWRNIEPDGIPPCNGEDWFLGANEQGAMCCFNFLDDTGMCWHCGPEDNAQLMDGLLWWAKVDAPDVTPNADVTGLAPAQENDK
jgi:hypothetical protein